MAAVGADQLELRYVAAEGAGVVVVLAVDVVGDGAAERDVLGARRDRKEEAAWHGEVEDLRQRNAGLRREQASDRVEVQQAIHGRGLEKRAVLEQADVAVASTHANGKRAMMDAVDCAREVALPVQMLELRLIHGIAAP